MALTLTLDESRKHFGLGQASFNAARHDQNDPASENLLRGIHEFFFAMAASDVQIIDGLNDLLKRVEKIEQALAVRSKP